MKNTKLNHLLFSSPDNSNLNQNFNKINLINLNNSNIYDDQKDKFIKTEISQNHDLSFCTKGENPENIDFYANNQNNTDIYSINNETTSTNHKNFDIGNSTDVNIKNKIMNLNSSLKNFNILVKNKFISYADFENCRNKNSYINLLLDYIIDLIWIIKEERSAKNEFVQKLKNNNYKNDEYEKKIKKLNNELIENKKSLNNALNKNQIEKENLNHFDGNLLGKKLNIEADFVVIKNENKKLNSQITIMKNEIKKKELEFSKLQEKVRKLLNDKISVPNPAGLNNSFSNNNNNTFNPQATQKNNNMSVSINKSNNVGNFGNDIFKLTSFINYDLNSNNLGNSRKKITKKDQTDRLNLLKNLYKKFLEFNIDNGLTKKYKTLLSQNEVLMKILLNFQDSLDKINKKIINFNKNNTNVKVEILDLIKLKENIFSLHLIDQELLNEFSDNFFDNIKLFEKIILRIIEFIYIENSEWKEKYKKLEKELININRKYNNYKHDQNNDSNFNNTYMENDNFDSKDSNSIMNNSTINQKKQKDLLRNLKRWSINKSSVNIPLQNNSINCDKISIRNSSLASRINNNKFEV